MSYYIIYTHASLKLPGNSPGWTFLFGLIKSYDYSAACYHHLPHARCTYSHILTQVSHPLFACLITYFTGRHQLHIRLPWLDRFIEENWPACEYNIFFTILNLAHRYTCLPIFLLLPTALLTNSLMLTHDIMVTYCTSTLTVHACPHTLTSAHLQVLRRV
jgi:hypothetical protein